MNIIFSALLNKLEETGVLSKKEVKTIRDLYTLSSIIEGKSKKLFSKNERLYLSKVKQCISRGNFNTLERLTPPDGMQKFHQTIIGVFPILKETLKKMEEKDRES